MTCHDFVSLPSPEMLLDDLIEHVFGDINSVDFSNRVILCSVNDDALAVNEQVLQKLDGPEKTYLSVDTVVDNGQISFFRSVKLSRRQRRR